MESNGMRETLRFKTNVPETVALAFDDGIDVEGRYGDQVMYTLEDDRVMYVSPVVREQVKKFGIRRGEQFKLVKREKKIGNRRTLEWVVERPKDGTPGEPAPPEATKPSSEAAHRLPGDPGTAEPTTAATRVNGASKPSCEDAPLNDAPFAGTLQGQYILSALVNMVDIAVAVEAYAKAKGRAVHFTSEDIRALTITCFIQRARQNGGVR